MTHQQIAIISHRGIAKTNIRYFGLILGNSGDISLINQKAVYRRVIYYDLKDRLLHKINKLLQDIRFHFA